MRLVPRLATAAALAAVAVSLVTPPADAAGNVRSAVSLSAPASGAYGSSINLTGVLWRYGTSTRIPNAAVTLQRAPHGKATWANLANARTNSTGGFAFAVKQFGAFDYRVTYPGSTTYTKATSAARYPVVTQKVLLDSIATTNQHAGELTVTGRVFPAPPRDTPVYLQRWDAESESWIGVRTGRTNYEKTVILANRAASVATYRLVIAARAPYGSGVSAPRPFAHQVWRGAFARGVLEVDSGGSGVVIVDRTDARRRKVTGKVTRTGWVRTRLDVAGCTTMVALNTNRITEPTSGNVLFYTDKGSIGTKFLRNGESFTFNVNLPAGSSVLTIQWSDDGDVGVHMDAVVDLLCNN